MLKAISDWEIIREYTAISYLYTVTIKTDSCVESSCPTEVRDLRTKMKLHEGNNYSLKKIRLKSEKKTRTIFFSGTSLIILVPFSIGMEC